MNIRRLSTLRGFYGGKLKYIDVSCKTNFLCRIQLRIRICNKKWGYTFSSFTTNKSNQTSLRLCYDKNIHFKFSICDGVFLKISDVSDDTFYRKSPEGLQKTPSPFNFWCQVFPPPVFSPLDIFPARLFPARSFPARSFPRQVFFPLCLFPECFSPPVFSP